MMILAFLCLLIGICELTMVKQIPDDDFEVGYQHTILGIFYSAIAIYYFVIKIYKHFT
jgi:hypothetical protein